MLTLGRTARLLLALALVVLSEGAAHAQAPPAARHVEDVLVEGTGNEALQRIVISEARIVTGRDVTDTEIRDAARRVRRLPFVIDVQPALRRGSVPGRYVLVFEVVPDATLLLEGEVVALEDVDIGYAVGTVGADRFLGKAWRVFGSVGTYGTWGPLDSGADDVSLSLGFERYGLLGEGSRLQMSLGSTVDRLDDGSFSAGSALVVPVARNQTLRFDVLGIHGNVSSTAGLTGSWLYETTDDPIAPKTGTSVQAQLDLVSYHSTDRYDLGRFTPDSWTWFNNVGVQAERSFPVWRGLSLAPRLHLSQQLQGELNLHSDLRGVARYVLAGRRNRYRAALEVGIGATTVIGTGRDGLDLGNADWTGSLGFSLRTRIGLVRVDYRPSWFQPGPVTK
jgi:hypothetical protein